MNGLLAMARREQAQHVFPAARSSQHVREVFEFCRGRLEVARGKSPWYASLHSCAATLEDEHAAHDVALDILKARKQGRGLARTQAPFNALNQGSAPFPSTFLHS